MSGTVVSYCQCLVGFANNNTCTLAINSQHKINEIRHRNKLEYIKMGNCGSYVRWDTRAFSLACPEGYENSNSMCYKPCTSLGVTGYKGNGPGIIMMKFISHYFDSLLERKHVSNQRGRKSDGSSLQKRSRACWRTVLQKVSARICSRSSCI